MFKTVVDLTTGEVSQVPLTEQELAEIANRPVEPQPILKCSPWQIRKVLNQLNLRESVESFIASSNDQELKDGWEFATEFIETDPFVVSLSKALGKTHEELHELFLFAGTL